ncbi:hypothetical protein BOX15_Mlig002205g1 [Macrostomum lignano]|uniref:Uncharacterized protein n=1 Tax=Macrostomum lignano TaxID=282301 RepID=A0A267FVK1_9PLAT|nr:hypothetical protein BOX15_Mlig002205g1 [Macrostomum lignano]
MSGQPSPAAPSAMTLAYHIGADSQSLVLEFNRSNLSLVRQLQCVRMACHSCPGREFDNFNDLYTHLCVCRRDVQQQQLRQRRMSTASASSNHSAEALPLPPPPPQPIQLPPPMLISDAAPVEQVKEVQAGVPLPHPMLLIDNENNLDLSVPMPLPAGESAAVHSFRGTNWPRGCRSSRGGGGLAKTAGPGSRLSSGGGGGIQRSSWPCKKRFKSVTERLGGYR